MQKFDEKLYLAEMYQDPYFPDFLVDKVKASLVEVVKFLETGERNTDKMQKEFDIMTDKINELQNEFWDNDSEIETGARDSIAVTVDHILKHFGLVGVNERSFNSEGTALGDELLRNRDW